MSVMKAVCQILLNGVVNFRGNSNGATHFLQFLREF
jgi:hypothetical protein